MPASISPYLFFGGRCEEAIEFYRKALGAELEMLMRFDESPDPSPPGMIPPGFEKKVMHASLTIQGVRLLLSDGCGTTPKFAGFQLALTIPTEAEAHRAYDALADGGQSTMPLSKTFWSPCYGQVVDRFGLDWMVMVPGEVG